MKMKRIGMLPVIMLLISGTASATELQGEITRINAEQITVEILANQSAESLQAGVHVNLKTLPGNRPTLDMLQG